MSMLFQRKQGGCILCRTCTHLYALPNSFPALVTSPLAPRGRVVEGVVATTGPVRPQLGWRWAWRCAILLARVDLCLSLVHRRAVWVVDRGWWRGLHAIIPLRGMRLRVVGEAALRVAVIRVDASPLMAGEKPLPCVSFQLL